MSDAHSAATDVYHGVTVLDEWRWLEDQDSAAVSAWVTETKERMDAVRKEAAKLFKEVYLETGSPREARKALLRSLP